VFRCNAILETTARSVRHGLNSSAIPRRFQADARFIDMEVLFSNNRRISVRVANSCALVKGAFEAGSLRPQHRAAAR
jgi:hypothetical protein